MPMMFLCKRLSFKIFSFVPFFWAFVRFAAEKKFFGVSQIRQMFHQFFLDTQSTTDRREADEKRESEKERFSIDWSFLFGYFFMLQPCTWTNGSNNNLQNRLSIVRVLLSSLSVCACIHRTVSFLFTFSPILRFFNRTSQPRMKRGGRRRAETKCEKEWIGFRCVCFIIFPTSFDQTVHLPFSRLRLLVFFSLRGEIEIIDHFGRDDGKMTKANRGVEEKQQQQCCERANRFFPRMLHIFVCNLFRKSLLRTWTFIFRALGCLLALLPYYSFQSQC